MIEIRSRVAWRLHCQGDTDSYTSDCGLLDEHREQKERKPQPAGLGQASNPHQEEQQQDEQRAPIPHYSYWYAPLAAHRPLAQLLPTGWLVLFK